MSSSRTNDPLYHVWATQQRELRGARGVGRLTLRGHSISARATGFFVDEFELMLDAGISSPFNPLAVLVSHLHGDHATHLPSILTAIDSAPLVCVPRGAAERVRAYLLAKERLTLDRDDVAELQQQMLGELRECVAGDSFDVPAKGAAPLLCRCFATAHSVSSVGYALLQRRPRLRAELRGVSPAELRKRREAGEELTEICEVPTLAYVGDSDESWLDDPLFAEHRFPFVICECTFVGALEDAAEAEARAAEHKHTLWEKLKPKIEAYNAESDEKTTFVLTHFSSRYTAEELQSVFDGVPNVLPWLFFDEKKK